MSSERMNGAVEEVRKFLENIKMRPSLPDYTAVPYMEIIHPPIDGAMLKLKKITMRKQLNKKKLSARRFRRDYPHVHSAIPKPWLANGIEPATSMLMLAHYERQSFYSDAFCRSAWDDYRAERRKAGHQTISAVRDMLLDWENTQEGDKGFVVWFIGYPGSGKTTLAAALYLRLFGSPSVPLVMLDNDMQRNRDIICAPALGHFFTIGGRKEKMDFSQKERMERTQRVARLIGRMSSGGVVIGATFCPWPAQREMFFEASRRRFVLIHVNTPLEVCRKRRAQERIYDDPKLDPGFGEFEPPKASHQVPPDLTIDTSREPLWKSVARVMRVLKERGWMGMPEYLRSQ